jgi:filamentous hemagglutinin
MEAAQADIEGWKDGGNYRAALHATGGALIAGLGGGNALAGAAGASAASLAGEKLGELSKAVGEGADTGNAALNETLGNIAANIVAGGIGGVVGGGSGAAMAANVDRFNRQLHPDEQKWIKDNAKAFAQQQNISETDAEIRLAQQGFRQVQAGVGGEEDAAARAFLSQSHGMLPADGSSGPSYMFHATAEQRPNADMYANYLPQDRNNNFYAKNQLSQPTFDEIKAAMSIETAMRNKIGGAVIAAPVAAMAVVGAPAVAAGSTATIVAMGAGGGGGFDAAGQYASDGKINPGQSIFAASTGAVTAPIGAATGFIGNMFLGGVTNAVNTTFNNLYYEKKDSPIFAGTVGSLFGGLGWLAGTATTTVVGQNVPNLVYPSGAINPAVPAILQGFPNPAPGYAGAVAGSVIQGGGSFVPSKEMKK